jgi:hypothetical protein
LIIDFNEPFVKPQVSGKKGLRKKGVRGKGLRGGGGESEVEGRGLMGEEDRLKTDG